MSWYQENKFAATILGVTAVVSGVFVYLGFSASSDAAAANQKERAAVDSINTLQASKPYPSIENKELLEDSVASFATDTKKFQETMLQFRPETLPKLSANEFSSEVSKHTNKLTNYYDAKNVALPDEKVYFGMEDYATKMAPESSTRYLNYQRQALDWLFTRLADSGIDKLENIHRAQVAENLGKPKPTTGKRNKRNKSASNTEISSVYDALPIEISFTGTEASLQKFMTEVAAGEEYFFVVKMLKISNNEQDPVTISKATFAPSAPTTPPIVGGEGTADEGVADQGENVFGEGAGGGFDLSGGDDFGVVEDKEIIKLVIGDEKITVLMQLELVLFKSPEDVAIPGTNNMKPKKRDSEKSSTEDSEEAANN